MNYPAVIAELRRLGDAQGKVAQHSNQHSDVRMVAATVAGVLLALASAFEKGDAPEGRAP